MTYKNTDVYTLIEPEILKLKKIGIDTANLDCRLLLSESLDRYETIYNHQNIYISEKEMKKFKNLVQQRLSGKPISRIINKRSFWKKEFELNDTTLDPRSDSETLIEAVIECYPEKLEFLKIIDLGSGTGCLGLSLLDEYSCSQVSFFDTSKKSLEIAKKNAQNFDLLERSKYINLDWNFRDWGKQLMKIENNMKYDIVISNPPYIPTNDIKTLTKEVKKYDPFIALDGGKDGLDSYRSIFFNLSNIIKSNGKIFFEIGKGQENDVTKIAIKHGLFPKEYKKDLSGVTRVIIFGIK
jgi:release factor glutamine methyltransferase|tara:strand:+ start:11280 stop:12167 length:888 start_codon:yes stop_codon:yes gene_type:complete